MQNLIQRAVNALIALIAILTPNHNRGQTAEMSQFSASIAVVTPLGHRKRRPWFRIDTSIQTLRAIATGLSQNFIFTAGANDSQMMSNFASAFVNRHLDAEEEGLTARSEATPRYLVGSVVSFVQHVRDSFAFMNRIALFKASGFLA